MEELNMPYQIKRTMPTENFCLIMDKPEWPHTRCEKASSVDSEAARLVIANNADGRVTQFGSPASDQFPSIRELSLLQ